MFCSIPVLRQVLFVHGYACAEAVGQCCGIEGDGEAYDLASNTEGTAPSERGQAEAEGGGRGTASSWSQQWSSATWDEPLMGSEHGSSSGGEAKWKREQSKSEAAAGRRRAGDSMSITSASENEEGTDYSADAFAPEPVDS